ncbi:MAG: cupin domain-containing protein [Anaerolineales bacterium]
MTRQLFTAADLRRIAREHRSNLLVLGHADLITPEAIDLAKELGVRIVREPPAPAAPSTLHAPRSTTLPPLKVVRGSGVVMEAFGAGLARPGANVRLKDVITSADGAPMAAGYMALDAPAGGAGEFPWTLSYDEIDVVLEGELVITRGSEVIRGGPGDALFIPKGSSITFGTPSHARFVYVTFPADWNS